MTQNPEHSGGVLAERYDGIALVCIFGDQPADLLLNQDLLQRLEGAEVVVVMSAGGLVTTWLGLGLALLEARPILIVDRICASSCANYIVPAARDVLAVKGSLIVWHGGPERQLQASQSPGARSLAADLERFAARSGISPRLYDFTNEPPGLAALDAIRGADGSIPAIIHGYAVSPVKLAACFGFQNLHHLWHPGGNQQVYSTGRALAKNLNFLESPREDCK